MAVTRVHILFFFDASYVINLFAFRILGLGVDGAMELIIKYFITNPIWLLVQWQMKILNIEKINRSVDPIFGIYKKRMEWRNNVSLRKGRLYKTLVNKKLY